MQCISANAHTKKCAFAHASTHTRIYREAPEAKPQDKNAPKVDLARGLERAFKTNNYKPPKFHPRSQVSSISVESDSVRNHGFKSTYSPPKAEAQAPLQPQQEAKSTYASIHGFKSTYKPPQPGDQSSSSKSLNASFKSANSAQSGAKMDQSHITAASSNNPNVNGSTYTVQATGGNSARDSSPSEYSPRDSARALTPRSILSSRSVVRNSDGTLTSVSNTARDTEGSGTTRRYVVFHE
jgi:hypothetical protein